MNATITELIERLKGLGYNLGLEGEKVRFRYVGAGEPSEEVKALLETLKACKTEAVAYLKSDMPRPYLEADGGLVIPFGSDSHYHWWKGGQSVEDTMKEITEGKERP